MDTDLICLHCGQEMKRKWEEYNCYYECDCPDAKHNREVSEKIEELKRSLRKPQFEIVTERQVRVKMR